MPANLPYPLQFDPSQWKNPYSRWAGVALPFYSTEIGSSGLYGDQVPTDAMGNPIQSYVDANNTAQSNYQAQLAAYNAGGASAAAPGTTLNSTGGSAAAGSAAPQVQTSGTWAGQGQGAAAPGSLAATPAMQELMGNYAQTQAAKSPQQLAIDAQQAAMLQQKLQRQDYLTASANAGGGMGQSPGGAFNPGGGYPTMMTLSQPQQAAAPAAAGRGPPPSPPNMTQAYLSALQNPGKVVTPGATVAQAPAPSNQSNVLQQFLADWQGGGGKTTGAGNYNNKGFFDALTGNV